MKILFVIKALGAGPGGGAERILAAVSSALAARGHKVSVLTFDEPGTPDFYHVGSEVRRIRLGIGSTTSRSGALVTAARLRQIRSVTVKLGPDIAVGFMHSSFVPLLIALIGTQVPVIGSERTSYRHYEDHLIDRWLMRASCLMLDQLTIATEGVRKLFPEPIARKMAVVPNPVLSSKSLADPVGGTPKVLLSVGGLRPEKDHSTLISAFARVATTRRDWRLNVVGDGPLRSLLEQQVRGLGLEGRVCFAGSVRDVEAAYQSAQLFVIPSIYEAFPNCLAEAMAHGLAAIGFSDCPGTNELIQSGINGILVPAGDRVTGLATALDSLMGSTEDRKRMGQRAVGLVRRYSLEHVTDRWENLLKSIVLARRQIRKGPE